MACISWGVWEWLVAFKVQGFESKTQYLEDQWQAETEV